MSQRWACQMPGPNCTRPKRLEFHLSVRTCSRLVTRPRPACGFQCWVEISDALLSRTSGCDTMLGTAEQKVCCMDWRQLAKLMFPEWAQRTENNRRWKELTKAARQNRRQNEMYRQEFWKEWSKLNMAGRDAYYRGDYAAANRLFEGLLGVAEKFDAYRFVH